MARDERRLRRQFEAMSRALPRFSSWIDSLYLGSRSRLVRLPLAVGLIIGGFLWFLPILGLWMLPLGLLLLALDVPALRPAVSAAAIRLRRRARQWIPRRWIKRGAATDP